MIQRIQTIYLILAVVIHLSLLYFPIYHVTSVAGNTLATVSMLDMYAPYAGTDEEATADINAAGQDGLILASLAINVLLILIGGISIMLFKNRPLQAKVAHFSLLLALVLIVLFFYIEFAASQHLNENNYTTEYGIGIWLPVLSMLLFMLAARAIRKDEALVRSADRLR